MTQANATARILESTFGFDPLATGLVLMVLTALVILGGIRSIGRFTALLVPFMIVGYVAAAFSVIIFFVLLDLTLITNRITKATERYDV